ncbi:phosphotransferase [Amycolatopsis circi]|uniref:phosphotransferase n=1 Tax=Amycolatopsis circi TaxID=871959 RepID=UPI000E231290|nr:phosphotransferase [Amycolatopsis circi]
MRGGLESHLIAGGRSKLTYRLSDGDASWVLRTPPRAGRTPSAHDVAREYRVTAALAGTGVPVARAVALCEDESLIGGPFAVAEYVDGHTIQTQHEPKLRSPGARAGGCPAPVRARGAVRATSARGVSRLVAFAPSGPEQRPRTRPLSPSTKTRGGRRWLAGRIPGSRIPGPRSACPAG